MMDEAAARAMVSWLDRDLSSTRQGWRVVYFHHTPYDPMRGNDPPEAALRAQVLPLLDGMASNSYSLGIITPTREPSPSQAANMLRTAAEPSMSPQAVAALGCTPR